MGRQQWIWIICFVLFVGAILGAMAIHHQQWGQGAPTTGVPSEPNAPNEPSKPTQPSEPTQPSQPTQPSEPTEPAEPTGEYLWGIDTASIVDETFYACVKEHFGEPAYVGRYLETKEGVSYGISKEEADFLHSQGLKIIPIYNHFTDATTYDRGAEEAQRAIQYAQEAGIPEGVAIFADVEPNYPVDKEFIRGWTETMLESPYVPGIYAVFLEASDSAALSSYLAFAWEHQTLASQLAVWTSDVEFGISTKSNAPESFNPEAENVTTVDIWQYGIDAEACNIDTNLMRAEFMDLLW